MFTFSFPCLCVLCALFCCVMCELMTSSQSLATEETQFSLEAVPDQSNKVAVITGGSRGIGYACAHTLLERNISKLCTGLSPPPQARNCGTD